MIKWHPNLLSNFQLSYLNFTGSYHTPPPPLPELFKIKIIVFLKCCMSLCWWVKLTRLTCENFIKKKFFFTLFISFYSFLQFFHHLSEPNNIFTIFSITINTKCLSVTTILKRRRSTIILIPICYFVYYLIGIKIVSTYAYVKILKLKLMNT